MERWEMPWVVVQGGRRFNVAEVPDVLRHR